MKQKKVILFFLKGSIPTEAERAAATALETCRFRNASLWRNGDACEPCDEVAGEVPAAYCDVPRADVPTPEKVEKEVVKAAEKAEKKADKKAEKEAEPARVTFFDKKK